MNAPLANNKVGLAHAWLPLYQLLGPDVTHVYLQQGRSQSNHAKK